jgi:hypothetical protein
MSLKPIADPTEIRNALEQTWATLKEGAEPAANNIGYQGGNENGDVYWRPDDRFWAFLLPVGQLAAAPGTWVALQPAQIPPIRSADPQFSTRRYWFCFGVDDPHTFDSLNITCEINIPCQGSDRRGAGALVKDEMGRVYLTHSGKVGGGRPGIGKEAFLAFYHGAQRRKVLWPDGERTEVIVVARVADPHLAAGIARFVHQVAAFKSHVTGR